MKRFAFGLIGLVLLASCGVTGALQRPHPMWNRAEAEAADARRQAAECQRKHRVCPASAPSTSPDSTSPNAPAGSATSPPTSTTP